MTLCKLQCYVKNRLGWLQGHLTQSQTCCLTQKNRPTDNVTRLAGKMQWIDEFSGLDWTNAGLTQATIVDCRLFQALVAATRNTRSRSNNLLVAGTTSAYELNDLRCWLDEVDQTGKVVPYYVDTWAQEHIAYTGSFPCCSSTPRSIIWQRPKRGYTIAQRLER